MIGGGRFARPITTYLSEEAELEFNPAGSLIRLDQPLYRAERGDMAMAEIDVYFDIPQGETGEFRIMRGDQGCTTITLTTGATILHTEDWCINTASGFNPHDFEVAGSDLTNQ